MSDFNENSDRLSPEKRAQVRKQLRERLSSKQSSPGIPQRKSSEPVPLSFSQNRVWFLAQIYPGQTAYNESSAYRFIGHLFYEAVLSALAGIVERHEVLRTIYHNQDGLPLQEVRPSGLVSLPIVNLTSEDTQAAIVEAQQRFQDVIEESFDLVRDLMMRVCLYRLGEADHILLVVNHHIVSDGWSRGIFWREFCELYTAKVHSRAPVLPPLSIQYADYANWQRGKLQGMHLEKGMRYWHEQLTDLTWLELPVDRRRPSTLSFVGAEERFIVASGVVEKLAELAAEEGATLYMALLAAYMVLLARYTEEDDIAVGSPIAGRTHIELESLIGFFVNTLVMRASLAHNPSFRSLLRQIRKTAVEAYGNQEIPFEKIVEELQPDRQLNRSPLISSTFQLVNQSMTKLSLPDIDLQAVDVPALHAKFDITCTLTRKEGTLLGRWIYATDLFDRERIRRMSDHFLNLLAGIVEDPQRTIGELPLLTEVERTLIVSEWSGSSANETLPDQTLVHELFEAQAKRTPDRKAIIAKNGDLTYRQLNERANQVAYRLMAEGVGPESVVGLCVDRSLEMMVGLLGILKAGGAFLPLDPDLPKARLRLLVENADPEILLTESALSSVFSQIDEPHYFDLDDSSWETYPSSPNPSSPVSKENLIYILFTSGSTGTPKGVMVEHRQLISYIFAVIHRYYLDGDGHFGMVQALSFDSCQTMIFPALASGGTIHLFSRAAALDAAAMSAYCQSNPIDYLKITPTHLQALMNGVDAERILPRRALILGGETLHWSLVDQLLALDSSRDIWNHYGPTETTVGVLTCKVNSLGKKHRELAATVPLGRPLVGAQIFILDQNGNLLPPGIPGELYIGGRFASRGYLNDPTQTDELFRSDFLNEPSRQRLYRSGDWAHFLPDGLIEFLGRKDDQVKIRGTRIELGEVATVLEANPDISEQLLLLRGGDNFNKKLVAYLVPRPGSLLSTKDIDSYLRARLPEVTVPALVLLDRIPQTSHGKIDYAALPVPQPILANKPRTKPRTIEEETIAAVWSLVFGLDGIGIHENFFELGGHSLTATQIVIRLNAVFQVEIPLLALFDNPTIAGLSTYISQKMGGGDFTEA